MKLEIELNSVEEMEQFAGGCMAACTVFPELEVCRVYKEVYRQIMKSLPEEDAKALHKELYNSMRDKGMMGDIMGEVLDRMNDKE